MLPDGISHGDDTINTAMKIGAAIVNKAVTGRSRNLNLFTPFITVFRYTYQHCDSADYQKHHEVLYHNIDMLSSIGTKNI